MLFQINPVNNVFLKFIVTNFINRYPIKVPNEYINKKYDRS